MCRVKPANTDLVTAFQYYSASMIPKGQWAQDGLGGPRTGHRGFQVRFRPRGASRWESVNKTGPEGSQDITNEPGSQSQ